MSEKERIVTPSDYLCVEEEFLPSTGTYVDEKGIVRASVVGVPIYDRVSRRVYVRPFKKVTLPKQGDVVVGVVSMMRDDVAVVKVLGFDIYNTFKTPLTGLLHISQVSETRISSLYDVVRLGDVVKAKILNDYLPLLLTIKEPKLGVILAYCSRCGTVLVKSGDRLICPRCGHIDQRKTSLDYLAIERKR